MGKVIDLAAYRRNKEIERSICWVPRDPIDAQLEKEFHDRQIESMQKAKGALHEVLERLTKLTADIRKEQSDAPSSTT